MQHIVSGSTNLCRSNHFGVFSSDKDCFDHEAVGLPAVTALVQIKLTKIYQLGAPRIGGSQLLTDSSGSTESLCMCAAVINRSGPTRNPAPKARPPGKLT
jgi:hypothetical protein